MSAADAKKFYELASSDKAVQNELKAHWSQVEAVAKKHGLSFTHAEYFDFVHEKTGMTKVGNTTSDDHDETDTCFCLFPSEPPRY